MSFCNCTKERYIKIPTNLANLASRSKNGTGQNVFATFPFLPAPIYIGATTGKNRKGQKTSEQGSRVLRYKGQVSFISGVTCPSVQGSGDP
jgi:hypothetical protein